MAGASRVCVVGAGVAGLTAAKALRDRGIAVVCYERADRIGGLWAFGNAGGNPTAYRSLRMNTSRARSALDDLALDGDPRGFAGHEELAAYLERYADVFALREHIRLRTTVQAAVPHPEGGWVVTTAGGDEQRFDGLVVASGHHWDPQLPEPLPPGRFAGRVLHAVDYVDPAEIAGRDVVVVGLGNSAMDIAVEVSHTARRTILSARRGVHILPRHVAGRPLDQLELPFRRVVPAALAGPAVGLLLRMLLARPGMRPENHGLPAPAQPFGTFHPTVSDEIFGRLDAGAIAPRGALTTFKGDRVRFADGRSEPADVVIFCTGYRPSIPYLPPGLLPTREGAPALFGHVIAPGVRDLWLAGFVQPIGPTPPLCEQQARWIAAHAAAVYQPPSEDAMQAEISRAARRRERFDASPRHALDVHFWPYLGWLRRELARGERRAGGRSAGASPNLVGSLRRRVRGPGRARSA